MGLGIGRTWDIPVVSRCRIWDGIGRNGMDPDGSATAEERESGEGTDSGGRRIVIATS